MNRAAAGSASTRPRMRTRSASTPRRITRAPRTSSTWRSSSARDPVLRTIVDTPADRRSTEGERARRDRQPQQPGAHRALRRRRQDRLHGRSRLRARRLGARSGASTRRLGRDRRALGGRARRRRRWSSFATGSRSTGPGARLSARRAARPRSRSATVTWPCRWRRPRRGAHGAPRRGRGGATRGACRSRSRGRSSEGDRLGQARRHGRRRPRGPACRSSPPGPPRPRA